MLVSQGMFALGSALCGAAKNMNWLIAARGDYPMMLFVRSHVLIMVS